MLRTGSKNIVLLEYCLNSSDHQLITDCYICRILYKYAVVITSQNLIIDTQETRKSKTKHITKGSHST